MILLVKNLFLLITKCVNKCKFIDFIDNSNLTVARNVYAVQLIVQRISIFSW